MKIEKLIGVTLCIGLTALGALADDNGGNGGNGGFEAQLVGSSVGQHVAGVPSGGAPWVISQGQVSVSGTGRIEVEIKGLLIASGPAAGTVGPVTMVMASLVCGDVVAASTKGFSLSTTGNAQIEDTIAVPSPCIAPAILIQIAA
ncbi:MAG TPA: hypothetical protein VGH38_16585, partial [Bryobacteraceae bacterium]